MRKQAQEVEKGRSCHLKEKGAQGHDDLGVVVREEINEENKQAKV